MTTTNLGMTLPTVGASSDVWGDELNANLAIIDAIFPHGTWTPADASGAGLSFTTPVGEYLRILDLVIAWGTVTYPVTADVSGAKIGGLPYTIANRNAARQGFLSLSSVVAVTNINPNNNSTNFSLSQADGSTKTNATASGGTYRFVLIYPAV